MVTKVLKDNIKNKMAKLLDMVVERLTKLESLKERLEQTEKTVVALNDRLFQAEMRLLSLEARPIYYQPVQPSGPWPNPVIPNMPPPGDPYVPPFYNPWPSPFTTICSKCGMNLTGALGYCCSTFGCPMLSQSTCTTKLEVQKGLGYTTVGDMKVAVHADVVIPSSTAVPPTGTNSTENVSAKSSDFYVNMGL